MTYIRADNNGLDTTKKKNLIAGLVIYRKKRVTQKKGVFRTLLNNPDETFSKSNERLKVTYYFHKKIHFICFTGF